MVKQVPLDLLELYRELLESIKEKDKKARSLWLLGWIYFAIQPLTLDELRFAIAINPNSLSTSLPKCYKVANYKENNKKIERRIKTFSYRLVEIKESNFRRVI